MSYGNGLVNEFALLLYDIQIQPDSHKIPATDVIIPVIPLIYCTLR